MPDRQAPLSRRRERRGIPVLTALAAGIVTLSLSPAATASPEPAADAVAGSLPTVTVRSTTATLTNLTPHTGVTRTAACPTGTLVGGGGYLRNATDPAIVPTNGLVLGGTSPSTGASPVDQPAVGGATNPGNWMAIANFTGVAEPGDQATGYALCATEGPTQTVVTSNVLVGPVANQQVDPPTLATATCPAGTTLIGGGAFTRTPDQVNDGTTVGNNGNLKPLGNYPSDSAGVPAADGSTSATSWSAHGSAGITTVNDAVTAIAVCTADPIAPVRVARADVSGPDAQPGTTITTATAVCPSGTRMLGGGYKVDETVNGTAGLQPQQGYHMRGSYPSTGTATPPADTPDGTTNPDAWSALLQAGGQNLPTGSSVQLHTFALCAQPAQAPAATPTSTRLSVTPSTPAPAGTDETLTATVTPDAPGTVQFRNGTALLGDPVTVTGGAASLTTTLPPGTHTLTATFTPTDPAAFTGSASAAVSYVVTAAATTTTALTAEPNPATAGRPVRLSATVSPRGVPGTVEFLDGTAALGAQPVKRNGTAQFTSRTLAPGRHTLTARFTPADPMAFGTSTSPPVTLTVRPPR